LSGLEDTKQCNNTAKCTQCVLENGNLEEREIDGYIQTGRGEIGSDKWRWAELDVYHVQFRDGENNPNYDIGHSGRDSNRTFF
jgi:hypothetical protein